MSAFKLLFLGTCACDFSPKLRTEFAEKFDDNARRASMMLMNEHFLIDCGPHCLDSMRIAGIDCSAITDIFVTHLHSDHFDPENIETIALAKTDPLRVWVSDEAEVPGIRNIQVIRMEKFVSYDIGCGFSVTGVAANHNRDAFPQHLLFEKQGEKFLYGCDGAWLMNETMEFLLNAKLQLLVLDGTCGDYVGDVRMSDHNSIPMIRLMLPSLKNCGVIDDKTEIYISHLAPSLHKPHAETVEIMKEMNVKVACDGLWLSV
ncbi:MAG: hypothetical protein E7487_09075 [Ruminococcaceae bacterium]|nr:hypothetical protein [Oscillospiraceae bacterium]